jgi:hypothetical protein
MKLDKSGLFVVILMLVVISCRLEPGRERGRIVIQNRSYNSTLEMSDVWLKEPGSMDWKNYWSGSCRGDSEYINELFFDVESGIYDVRIQVLRYGYFHGYYETGYMQSIRVEESGSKFIIYDGNGIYDMEQTVANSL